jgi:predicted AlkP superfamily pyrophosphatase or phosphodiesterase
MFRNSYCTIAALAVCAALLVCGPAFAQTTVYTSGPTPAPTLPPAKGAAPKLIVAISVDQFSADLFAEYRGEFSSGLKRLQQGAVFPAGYQSHSATETCPGHATILTGNRPGRAGIIANEWIELNTAREDKKIYCAEDESVPGSTSTKYTVSDKHLKVPTLGERMKAANSGVRVVSVAGKDRSAVMMGGHKVDELWWWAGKGFESYTGRQMPGAVKRANGRAASEIADGAAAMPLPEFCVDHSRAIAIGGGKSVGDGRFARKSGDPRGWRAAPYFDNAVINLAGELAIDMGLGKGPAVDVLAIGASATDYIGHTYGTSGSEMCIQLMMLDQQLGGLFARLDNAGVDYVAMLTADHGGHDLPERIRELAIPDAQRIAGSVSVTAIGEGIAKKLKLKVPPLHSEGLGDVWIDLSLNKAQKAKVQAAALAAYRAHPMVAAAYSKAEIAATQLPSSPPESWTTIERARASFDPALSGDLFFALKPHVTPIPDASMGYVATHGSVWDYDRRVPILFWHKDMARFEQPLSVETVDIAPTLAALIGLSVPAGQFDGRCLDLEAGAATTCK